MNRQELNKAISAEANIPKTEVDRILDSFFRLLMECILKGEKVKLTGIGTIQLRRTCGRRYWNPKTRKVMELLPDSRPKFTPSALLKRKVKCQKR